MTWMQTYTGQAVDLLRPDPNTIRLRDIAVALSRVNRFTGHTQGARPYNVAHHSVLCETLVPAGTPPDIRLMVLLHDAHEAYTGDAATPLKQALRAASPVGSSPLDAIQDRLQDAIETAFGLDRLTFSFEAGDPIKAADMLALAIEARDLMGPPPEPWGVKLPDTEGHAKVEPLDPWESSAVFENRVRMLVREAGLSPIPGVMEP
jgi:hypothetical protein